MGGTNWASWAAWKIPVTRSSGGSRGAGLGWDTAFEEQQEHLHKADSFGCSCLPTWVPGNAEPGGSEQEHAELGGVSSHTPDPQVSLLLSSCCSRHPPRQLLAQRMLH